MSRCWFMLMVLCCFLPTQAPADEKADKDVHPQNLYTLDLRDFNKPDPYVQEVKRIAVGKLPWGIAFSRRRPGSPGRRPGP